MRTVTELLGMRSEEEVAEFQALCDASDLEDLQEAWDELQAVASYVETEAAKFASEQ